MRARRADGGGAAPGRRTPRRRPTSLPSHAQLNPAVALAKAAYGCLSGSLTLGTDALHSILDASSNVLALFGLRWAAVPADARSPYGRRRIEILAALGIGVLIVVGLFEFGAAAIHSLVDRHPAPRVGLGGFAIVLATMAVNLSVARYEHRKAAGAGQRPASSGRAAHAVGAVRLGGGGRVLRRRPRRHQLGGREQLRLLLVALIGHAAWEVFHENVPVLIDAAMLDPHSVVALAGPLRARRVCPPRAIARRERRVELDLRFEVAPDMSMSRRTSWLRAITMELKVKFPEVSDVIIHIEPKTQSNAR